MSTFRAYLALLRKYWLIILAFTSIFLILVFAQGGRAADEDKSFSRGHMNAAVSIPAGGHGAGEAFALWLEQAGHAVKILAFSQEEAQEAVFLHQYDAVFLFEPGLTAPQAVSDRTSGQGYFALSVAETYFRYLDAFQGQGRPYDPQAFHSVLAEKAEVLFQESGRGRTVDGVRVAFFSALGYVLLLMSLTLVPLVNQAFFEAGVRSRSNLSPYPPRLRAVAILLGSGLIVFGTAAVLFLATLPISMTLFSPGQAGGILLNLSIFSLAVLALSYLVSSLIRNKVAITAVSTVLSLGMAFLSGAFVPQSMLGQTALGIGRCFPLYYFIHANYRVNTVGAMAGDLLIQLGFAAGYFLAALLAARLARRARRQFLWGN